MIKKTCTLVLVGSQIILSSCQAKEAKNKAAEEAENQTPPALHQKTVRPSALIYQGDATAYGDVEAISEILDTHHLKYSTVTSAELNQMSIDDLKNFGVLIWPGGYAGQMSGSLYPKTRENIRDAVLNEGLNFVGFCAGAFMAISPEASPQEEGPEWGLALISAPILPYYHLEDEGTEYSMVDVNFPDKTTRSLVWWGGPYLPDFKNGTIAKYADTQQPAIIQTSAGKGFVVIAGPHPEAPEEWRTKLGLQDPDGIDQEIAWQMIDAAVTQIPLPAYR